VAAVREAALMSVKLMVSTFPETDSTAPKVAQIEVVSKASK
jgi:hypothetical protein